jgi:hypothetical protein
MAESKQDINATSKLSVRIEGYRQEIQALVKQGREQPQFE